jgi:hypothetical protein
MCLASSICDVVRRDRMQGRGGLYLGVMQPFKAFVKNGRLMVDEPTELPDGTEIELLPVDVSIRSSELDCFKPSTKGSKTSHGATTWMASTSSLR